MSSRVLFGLLLALSATTSAAVARGDNVTHRITTSSPVDGSAAQAPPSAKRIDLRLKDGDWGSRDVTRDVLESAANTLLVYFPNRQPVTIDVSQAPRKSDPRTVFQLYPNQKLSVEIILSAWGYRWSKHVYQFSHELCHVLATATLKKEEDRSNMWFEEAMCEAASLFALRRLSVSWALDPRPERREYAKYHEEYARDRINDVKAPVDLIGWLSKNEASLRADPSKERARQDELAVILLNMLEAHPEHWESLSTLNTIRSTSPRTFRQYLEDWHNSAPEKHKQFIRDIATRFGISIARPPEKVH